MSLEEILYIQNTNISRIFFLLRWIELRNLERDLPSFRDCSALNE